MLLLLPLIFYGLTAIVLGILRLRGMRMAFLWLLPVFISLACWIIFLVTPIPSSANLLKIPGLFSLSADEGLSFIIDSSSWGFIYLVISLVLGYFLTMVIRLEKEKRTWLWVGWVLLCMAAIFSFSAGNLTTLILAWVLFDLLDILFTYFILKLNEIRDSLNQFLPSRVISVLLLITAGIFLPAETPQWLPSPLDPAAYFLLLLAGLFRTGLLPTHTLDQPEAENRSSFLLVKRILPVLAGFSLLSFLPINFLNQISQILLSVFFLILAIVFIILLIQKRRNFTNLWLNSLICLGCIAVISGTPIAMLGWGGVALLGLSIPYFFTHRTDRIKIFALLGVFSLSGIPYSIGALALAGLTSASSFLWLIPVLPVYVFLLVLFIDDVQMPYDEGRAAEPLYLAVHLMGLFIMSFSSFAILIKNAQLAGSVLKYWWAGITVVILCLVMILLKRKVHLKSFSNGKLTNSLVFINRLFAFQWLEKLWRWLAWFLSGIINFLTQLLAGEGGVIWAIVILALLVSLISIGRS